MKWNNHIAIALVGWFAAHIIQHIFFLSFCSLPSPERNAPRCTKVTFWNAYIIIYILSFVFCVPSKPMNEFSSSYSFLRLKHDARQRERGERKKESSHSAHNFAENWFLSANECNAQGEYPIFLFVTMWHFIFMMPIHFRVCNACSLAYASILFAVT